MPAIAQAAGRFRVGHPGAVGLRHTAQGAPTHAHPGASSARLGYEAMDETSVNWWMDDTSRWHRGVPPAGWRQADDGRWHPPGDNEPTVEMSPVLPGGAAHLGRGSADGAGGWGWPRWARIGVLASVVLAAVVVIAGAAMTDGGGEDDGAVVIGRSTTTSTVAGAPSATTGQQAPDTRAPAASTAGPTTTEGSDAPAPDTTEPVPPTTTVAPEVPPTPAPTAPAPSGTGARPGSPCSPEGATAITQDGVPMTCTAQKCHGAPFDSPRWRRTAC